MDPLLEQLIQENQELRLDLMSAEGRADMWHAASDGWQGSYIYNVKVVQRLCDQITDLGGKVDLR